MATKKISRTQRPVIRAVAEAGQMAQITVTVTGASNSATVTWDGALTNLVNGTASFPTAVGFHVYAIVVFGKPGDPWTAKVTDGKTTQNHSGHMSPSGTDTTGDTPFQAS